MKKTVIALVLSVTLVIAGFSVVSVAFAQSNTYNNAPAQGNTANGQVNGTNTTNTGTGFDWRWLLPLLAIPVLFLFLGENKAGENTRYYDQGVAGTKGGQAKKKKVDDKERSD